MKCILFIITAISLLTTLETRAQNLTDNDRLEMAIDYFQSSKYNEALNIFEDLERRHKLNPRYLAYMGLCYYYEWEFKKAYEHFEKSLPALEKFSPQELSVYHFACAESYFALEKYNEATPFYEKALSLCYDNEKGDIYFRLGFCYIQREEWQRARNYLQLSQNFYLSHRNTEDLQARLRQIENMIQGCTDKIMSLDNHIVTDE